MQLVLGFAPNESNPGSIDCLMDLLENRERTKGLKALFKLRSKISRGYQKLRT